MPKDILLSEVIKKFQKYLIDSIEDQFQEGEINERLRNHWVELTRASDRLETIFRVAMDIKWSLPLTIQVFFQSAGEDPNCPVLLRMDQWFKEEK